MTNIQEKLFALRDEKFCSFNSALIPSVDKNTVIGVRTPQIKKLANQLIKSGLSESFIASLPHVYFEENQLHAFIIAQEKDFEKCISRVNRFLPYIDNWATCDQLSPKCFYKNADALTEHIFTWIKSSNTYEKRFGIVCLMRYFLDEDFKPEYAHAVADIKSDEYYIKMAVAWYFATALSKQYDTAFAIIAENRLDVWTHNKTIQKALESFRISDDKKQILRGLKRCPTTK